MLQVFQDFAEVLEALFAVFIKILNQTLFLYDFGHILTKGQLSTRVLSQSVIAFDDVFKKSGGWLFNDLCNHHVVQNGAHCQESLCGLTEVVETLIIEQDLLNDESGYCL